MLLEWILYWLCEVHVSRCMSVGDNPALVHAVLDIVSVELEINFQDSQVATAVIGHAFEKPLLTFGGSCTLLKCLVCILSDWLVRYELVVCIGNEEALDVCELVRVSPWEVKGLFSAGLRHSEVKVK